MERIGKIISVLSNQVHKLNNKAFRDLNISHSEAITLMRIEENPEISLEKLSQLMFIDKSATTRLVNILCEKEYILKTVSPKDKRKFCLRLTDDGQLLLPKIQHIFDTNSKILLTGISKDEEDIFRNLVSRMIMNARGD